MSGDPTRVRVADERDEDELFEMCKVAHEENGLFSFSPRKVRSVIRSAVIGPVESRRGIIGVIGNPGELQASICLEFSSTYYSDDIGLFEQWSFVRKEFRRSNNISDLIAWAQHIRLHFATPLVIAVVSNQRTAAKVRLFRRSLGEPAGAFFIQGGTTGRGIH